MKADPAALLWFTAVFSATCLLVLALRPLARRLGGAGAAYGLWCLPPLMLLALSLPAPPTLVLPMREIGALPSAVLQAGAVHAESHAGIVWLVAWLLGAVACLGWQCWRQHRFVRALGPLARVPHPRLPLYRAGHDAGLPALVGLWRPRIVLPPDFETRYEPAQRTLLLRHEQVHRQRGDLPCNALAVLLLCVQWFNPLAHVALRAFRRDQEMACDARVLARRPRQRRTYAEAMLIGGVDTPLPPLGCPWPSRHPLKERIEMLKQPTPSRRRRLAAVLSIGLLATGGGYAAWAAQPATPAVAAERASYRTDVVLTIDGERHEFALVERAGQWLGFGGEGRQGHWQAELRWTALGDGRMQVDMKLSLAGQPVSTPKLIVTGDQPTATVDVTSRDGGSRFTAALRVTPAQAPAKVSEVAMQSLPPPRYPKDAVDRKLGGQVILRVDVRADGSVSDVVVESSRPAGVFDAVSVEAARQWRFRPEMKDGKPVAGQVRVPVTFEMDATPPAAGGSAVAAR
jgi:TonB family protein